ncbi:MAG TPA: P1 family peptidase [Bryobacteraceae bacterium]|nr:P1 family peptidase [Bryobacteraceae bacterium]
MKGLTDIPGIRVGHVSDFQAITGCTAILCPGGAVGGVDIRGSASGTEETPVLHPGHVTSVVHGILLAGGSAFGLEAASGARRYLERHGVGYDTGAAKVPIVPAAIIYDLAIGKPDVRPTAAMGEAAAAAASDDPVKEGCVGAGTGATVGKILGMRQAMKSGIGSFTVTLAGGTMVSCLVVVNAFGDVRDPASGKIIAGARTTPEGAEFANTEERMKRGAAGGFPLRNTTLAVVATNARISKVEATKLAQQAGLGMARTIFPVNTMFDGDLVFALSLGDRQADINVLGVAAAEAVAQSIVRAVQLSKSLGGVPGLLQP